MNNNFKIKNDFSNIKKLYQIYSSYRNIKKKKKLVYLTFENINKIEKYCSYYDITTTQLINYILDKIL